MLSFNERLVENDALIDDQAALEVLNTCMHTITNNIAGVAAKCKHGRDAFEHLKGLQDSGKLRNEAE